MAIFLMVKTRLDILSVKAGFSFSMKPDGSSLKRACKMSVARQGSIP